MHQYFKLHRSSTHANVNIQRTATIPATNVTSSLIVSVVPKCCTITYAPYNNFTVIRIYSGSNHTILDAINPKINLTPGVYNINTSLTSYNIKFANYGLTGGISVGNLDMENTTLIVNGSGTLYVNVCVC